MSEPESLSQDEGLETHIRRHSYDRLLMISDGIFAIAITLAALEIKLPEEMHGEVADIAKAMLRPIASYLISFLLIALFWLHHRDLFARVRRVDAVLTGLTMLLLCLISLIPVMVHGIYLGAEDNLAGFRLYILAMLACGVTSLAMWLYVIAAPGILRPEVPRAYRIVRTLMAAVLPAVMVPALFIEHAEQLIWVMVPLAIVAGVVRRFIMPRWLNAKE
jgi:uncharacterized membrane protein